MKIFEIENTEYDKIIEDCKPFFEMINYDTRYIPFRDVGNTPVNGATKIKTRDTRTPIGTSPILVNIIDSIFTKENVPSRYKKSVICSTLGENSSYSMNMLDTYHIIPVGDFKYGYIDNDFNDFYLLTHMAQHILYISECLDNISKSTYDDHDEINKLKDLFNATKNGKDIENFSKNIEYIIKKCEMIYQGVETFDDIENYDNVIDKISDIVNDYSELYKKLSNINTTNYKNAFSKENELWFQCDSFYAISTEEIQYNKKFINSISKIKNSNL